MLKLLITTIKTSFFPCCFQKQPLSFSSDIYIHIILCPLLRPCINFRYYMLTSILVFFGYHNKLSQTITFLKAIGKNLFPCFFWHLVAVFFPRLTAHSCSKGAISGRPTLHSAISLSSTLRTLVLTLGTPK